MATQNRHLVTNSRGSISWTGYIKRTQQTGIKKWAYQAGSRKRTSDILGINLIEWTFGQNEVLGLAAQLWTYRIGYTKMGRLEMVHKMGTWEWLHKNEHILWQ